MIVSNVTKIFLGPTLNIFLEERGVILELQVLFTVLIPKYTIWNIAIGMATSPKARSKCNVRTSENYLYFILLRYQLNVLLIFQIY